MITLEFDEKGNVVPRVKPKVNKSESFHFKPKQPVTSNQQLATTDLENQHAALLLQRNKLSTSIAPMVESIRVKLLAESPELAAAFMRGDMAMPELRELRGKIDAVQEQMMEVYDKIEHLKTYGKLPEPVIKGLGMKAESEDIKAVRYEMRRLDDLIYKKNKALRDKPNAKPDKKLDWIETIALAEAKREDLKHKIKRLEYEGRNRAAQANEA